MLCRTKHQCLLSQVMPNMKESILQNRSMLLFCFASTFVLGLAAHAFVFFNLTLSHDSLLSFYATQSEISWKLELGRFLVPVYQIFFRGKLAAPWLIGFLSLVFLSLTSFLLCKLFQLTSRPAVFLLSGVLAVNLTVIAQAGTYLFELDCNMLSLLLCVGSVCFLRFWAKPLGLLLSLLLMFCSMGLYQSYVSVAITLVMMLSILDLLGGQQAFSVFLRACTTLVLIAAAFALYTVTATVSCAAFHVTLQERVDVFAFPPSENPILFLLRFVKEAYSVFFDLFLKHPVYISAGERSTMMFPASVCIASLILSLLHTCFHRKLPIINRLSALTCVALLPLGMNAIYVLSRGFIHDLMIYAFWLAFPFSMALAQSLSPSATSASFAAVGIKGLAALAATLFLWQNIVVANTFYVKKETEAQSTFFAITRIVSALEQHPDFSVETTPVVFIGTGKAFASPDIFTQANQITGGASRSAITYYQTYPAYFNYILNSPIQIADTEVHNRLLQTELVKEMPIFPQQGSIRLIEGTMVVKLG